MRKTASVLCRGKVSFRPIDGRKVPLVQNGSSFPPLPLVDGSDLTHIVLWTNLIRVTGRLLLLVCGCEHVASSVVFDG